ncbi:MAG: HD domain-containing protein [Planctomycetota bacterium]|jgi:hypothetical protein
MTSPEAIWNRARADEMIVTESGDQDVFLWEHCDRVARWAQHIARFDAIQEHSPDATAIVAAALYHDAGWITRFREGEVERIDVVTRAVSDAHYEQSALVMERSLAGLLPRKTLRRASEAIRAITDRGTRLIEAQVISDAESLGEFCLLALWPAIRRSAIEGKGVQAAIDTWHRRKEYQFWTARLKDSFHFAPVRDLARARLAKYGRAMMELEQHNEGTDILLAQTPNRAERGDTSGQPTSRF